MSLKCSRCFTGNWWMDETAVSVPQPFTIIIYNCPFWWVISQTGKFLSVHGCMVELSFSFHDFMVIPLMSELRGRPVHSQKLTSTPYLSVIQIVLTQSESDIYFQCISWSNQCIHNIQSLVSCLTMLLLFANSQFLSTVLVSSRHSNDLNGFCSV